VTEMVLLVYGMAIVLTFIILVFFILGAGVTLIERRRKRNSRIAGRR